MDVLLKQEDGTYIKLEGIKVEISGTGIVSYPDKESEDG